MRKFVYLFAACCIFAAAVLSANAGPGCEKHTKNVEAIVLSASELEDGKVIEVGDGGKLTMKQDGDAWTFTLTSEEGNENSVFTIALDGDQESAKCIKVITTSDGDDVWTEVSTGEEHHLDGKHCAIFIGDEGHDGEKVICKQFETVHGGQAYTCSECGLVISVPREKDKGAYTCPNDGTEMTRADHSKEIRKQYAYKVVTDTDVDKEVEVAVEEE